MKKISILVLCLFLFSSVYAQINLTGKKDIDTGKLDQEIIKRLKKVAKKKVLNVLKKRIGNVNPAIELTVLDSIDAISNSSGKSLSDRILSDTIILSLAKHFGDYAEATSDTKNSICQMEYIDASNDKIYCYDLGYIDAVLWLRNYQKFSSGDPILSNKTVLKNIEWMQDRFIISGAMIGRYVKENYSGITLPLNVQARLNCLESETENEEKLIELDSTTDSFVHNNENKPMVVKCGEKTFFNNLKIPTSFIDFLPKKVSRKFKNIKMNSEEVNSLVKELLINIPKAKQFGAIINGVVSNDNLSTDEDYKNGVTAFVELLQEVPKFINYNDDTETFDINMNDFVYKVYPTLQEHFNWQGLYLAIGMTTGIFYGSSEDKYCRDENNSENFNCEGTNKVQVSLYHEKLGFKKILYKYGADSSHFNIYAGGLLYYLQSKTEDTEFERGFKKSILIGTELGYNFENLIEVNLAVQRLFKTTPEGRDGCLYGINISMPLSDFLQEL